MDDNSVTVVENKYIWHTLANKIVDDGCESVKTGHECVSHHGCNMIITLW